jgi:predicted small lipoprotein YifL
MTQPPFRRFRAGLKSLATLAALASLSACGDEPTGPNGGPLVPGESRVIAGATNSEKVFSITVPEGTGTLQITLTGGVGDADLVVRFGARPEPGLFDCVSESEGNEEECLFDAPEPGT